MKEETKFEVGDKVEAFGCEGVVIKISNSEYSEYPVDVEINDGGVWSFTTDGRVFDTAKEISLKLISKAKKKKKFKAYLTGSSYVRTIEFLEDDRSFDKAVSAIRLPHMDMEVEE